jgi:hypothetical protein
LTVQERERGLTVQEREWIDGAEERIDRCERGDIKCRRGKIDGAGERERLECAEERG